MTQDEAMKLARQAGLHIATDVNWMPIIGLEYAEKLIALTRADEREACAKLCDEASDIALVLQSSSADDLSSVFLRHQTLAHQNDAAAIRARGQA